MSEPLSREPPQPERCVVSSAAALLIGDELLSGKTQEQNLVHLATTLRHLGIAFVRAAMVPDELDAIGEELTRLRQLASVVITSGGVGPTHDDVTVEAVAKCLGVEVHRDRQLEAMLKNVYGDRLTEGHLRMALVPKGAELVITGDVQWPTIRLDNVWLLPGIPDLFRMKLLVLRQRLVGPAPFFTRAAYTRAEEGQLTHALDLTVAAYPSVQVGSYPRWFDPECKTKVTFDSRDADAAAAALDHFILQICAEDLVRQE